MRGGRTHDAHTGRPYSENQVAFCGAAPVFGNVDRDFACKLLKRKTGFGKHYRNPIRRVLLLPVAAELWHVLPASDECAAGWRNDAGKAHCFHRRRPGA
jgi:hypothetical protein